MDRKYSYLDLTEGLMSRKGMSRKDAEVFVRTIFEIIEQYLLLDKVVKVKGFGTFKIVAVSNRESVNIHTGERIVIAGHSKITFTPDSSLRDTVNKPFADFETIILNDSTSTEDMEKIDGAISSVLVDEQNSSTESDKSVFEVDETETTCEDTQVSKDKEKTSISSEEIVPLEEHLDKDVEAIVVESSGNSLIESNDLKHDSSDEDKEELAEDKDSSRITSTDDSSVSKELSSDGKGANELFSNEETNVSGQTPIVAVDETSPVVEKHTNSSGQKKNDISEGNNGGELNTTDNTLRSSTENNYSDNPSNDEKSTDKSLLLKIVAGFVVLLIVVAAYWFGSRNSTASADKVIAASADTAKKVAEDYIKQQQQTAKVESEVRDTIPQVEGGKYIITGTRGEYTVQPGEILLNIAKKIYHDKKAYIYIAVYNNLNPDSLEKGTVLKLPKLEKK